MRTSSTRTRLATLAALTLVAALVAAVLGSNASGQAVNAPVAYENATAAPVFVHHTGAGLPSPGYTPIGQLTLPPGEYLVTAKTNFQSSLPSVTVQCYLTAPDTMWDEGLTTLNSHGGDLGTTYGTAYFTQTTNLPAGGQVTLLCRVPDKNAPGHAVIARFTKITATAVNNIVYTNNAAPASA